MGIPPWGMLGAAWTDVILAACVRLLRGVKVVGGGSVLIGLTVAQVDLFSLK